MHQRSSNYQAAEQKIKIITSQRQNVLFHLMSFFFLLHSLYYFYYCFVLSFMNQKSLESLYLNQCSFMHCCTVGKLLKKEKKRREILWFIILPLFVSLHTHFRSTLSSARIGRRKENCINLHPHKLRDETAENIYRTPYINYIIKC